MAPTPPPPSFNDFIQNERKKKQNEILAQEIFGRGRNTTHPKPRTQQPTGGSLLSRVNKPGSRSTSSSGVNRQQLQRALRDGDHDQGTSISPRVIAKPSPTNAQFSIKGKAGPFVVIGKNFATGTSALDIRTTMEPIGGEMLACSILESHPVVIAEMVFTERGGAAAVVERFNQAMADGRVLSFYQRSGPPQVPLPAPAAPRADRSPPKSHNIQGPTHVAQPTVKEHPASELLQSETGGRSHAGRNGRNAEPTVQDGTMGFPSTHEEVMEMDHSEQPPAWEGQRRGYDNGRDSQRDQRDHRDQRDQRDRRYGEGWGYSRGRGYGDRRGNVRDSPREYDNRHTRHEDTLYSDHYSRPDNRGGYRGGYR